MSLINPIPNGRFYSAPSYNVSTPQGNFVLGSGLSVTQDGTLLVASALGGTVSQINIGAGLIGVNARDLSTFELDRTLFGSVRGLIPADAIAVAESAVNTVDDVRAYREAGADVVLVGEALVTSGNPRSVVEEFREVS
jgi:indole-3-glycerol phosphate synthase